MAVLRNPPARPRLPHRDRAVEYPESDGKPMAESDWHWHETVDIAQMLADRYRDAPDVYVASDNFIYYVEGDPKRAVSPDVYVVFGVPKHVRPVYKLWQEGAAPSVVFEITSRSTRREDLVKKRDLYAWLGVDEYFLDDPLREYLDPPLQGFRLDRAAGAYQPLRPDAAGRVVSERLGLRLWWEDGKVRLVDAATGKRLMSTAEVREAMRDTEARAAAERAARQAAEARMADERAARDAAEAELARLRAEVERLRGAGGG